MSESGKGHDRASDPGYRSIPSRRRTGAVVVLLMTAFVLIGGVGIGALGIPSEEILPHLFQHPRVVSADSVDAARILLEAPHDLPGGAERSGFVVSRIWPVLSVIRPPWSYPILAESWQSAHLSYLAAALKPLLGGGIEGLRRTSLVLGAFGILLVYLLAPRLARRSRPEPWLGVIAAAWFATSVGVLFLCRMAYLIESAPPVLAALALFWALDKRASRLVLAGLAAGLAVAMKVTTGWVLLGMALYLLLSGRFPRQPLRAWIGGAVAALIVISPIALFFVLGGHAAIIHRSVSLGSNPFRALHRLPHIALITATYLGHPDAILQPLLAGEKEIVPRFWAILVPLAVTGFAIFRVLRRPADRDPELLWLCITPVVLVFGALLYANDNPFQMAFLIAPYHAIVLARALHSLQRGAAARVRGALAAGAICAAAAGVQVFEIVGFVGAHRSIGNPMFAIDAQREIVSALVARGVESPFTTTYNSVGFYEFLSDHRLAPVHLYPILFPGPDAAQDRATFERAWKIALLSSRRWVVLPLGYNIFEGGRQDPGMVRDALLSACGDLGVEAREVERFPAAGPAAFGLYEIVGEARSAEPIKPIARNHAGRLAEATPASAGTRAALGGLGPGLLIGSFHIESVTEPLDGAVLVHAKSASGDVATFEVRLLSSKRDPPARSGSYAVYYRGVRGNASPRDLVDGAQAIADHIARAPRDLPPPAGLTQLPEGGDR